MTKLVAAICAYEEENNIEDCLESLLKIKDLDAVDILDGAWNHGGNSMYSKDNTMKLVDDLRISKRMPYEIYYTYREIPNLWKNESTKRNWQLQDIFYRWGPDTWIFVFDADEEIEIKDEINLKPYLQTSPNPWSIEAHSINTKIGMITCRIWKADQGIHYHTNKAMCLHDKNCNVIQDYELGVTLGKMNMMTQFKILNKGIKRSPERLKQKTAYFAHRIRTEGGRCRIEKSF